MRLHRAVASYDTSPHPRPRLPRSTPLLFASVVIDGFGDDQSTDAFIADALAAFSGRRTGAVCTDERREYALELTIAGETIVVPDDTAVDVGGYRVLVDTARSYQDSDGSHALGDDVF